MGKNRTTTVKLAAIQPDACCCPAMDYFYSFRHLEDGRNLYIVIRSVIEIHKMGI